MSLASLLYGFSLGFIVFLVLLFIPKDSKYSHFGINLKRVFCPECGLKQPYIRSPKNERQLKFGGYTCQRCKTEIDKFGRKA